MFESAWESLLHVTSSVSSHVSFLPFQMSIYQYKLKCQKINERNSFFHWVKLGTKAHSSYGNQWCHLTCEKHKSTVSITAGIHYSTRDLAQSSNICLDRDGQICGWSVGEDSDSRRLTTTHLSRALSNHSRRLCIPPCPQKYNRLYLRMQLYSQIILRHLYCLSNRMGLIILIHLRYDLCTIYIPPEQMNLQCRVTMGLFH